MRFWLRDNSWREVSKEEWVRAERAAGFRNTMGEPDEPATSSFSARRVAGTITVDEDPNERQPR